MTNNSKKESLLAKIRSSRYFGAGLLAAVLLGSIIITTWLIFSPQTGIGFYSTEIIMVLAIILGSAALLTVLTVVAVIFSALKLQDKKQALGLPEGSVRAIIAICLIILFVMMSIYLFRSIGTTVRPITGAYWNGSAFVPVNGTAYIPIEPSEDQISIANNIVTTVGTLVVALAGFYFGTRAVTVARGEEAPTLTLVSPTTKTHELAAADKQLKIVLKPTPEGEGITWETPPEGDKEGRLVQDEPNRFTYEPDKDFKGTATLRFKLSRYPDVKVELEVRKPGQPPGKGEPPKGEEPPKGGEPPEGGARAR